MYYYLICCTLLPKATRGLTHGLRAQAAAGCAQKAGSEPASYCPPSCLLSLIHDFYNIWLFRNGSRAHMQHVLPRVARLFCVGVSLLLFAVRFDHPPPISCSFCILHVRRSVRLLAVVQLLPL